MAMMKEPEKGLRMRVTGRGVAYATVVVGTILGIAAYTYPDDRWLDLLSVFIVLAAVVALGSQLRKQG